MAKEIGLENFTKESEVQFISDLKDFLSLKPREFKFLYDVLNTKKGFDVSNEKIKKINKALKLGAEKTKNAASISTFLFRESVKTSIPTEDVIEELKSFCKSKNIKWFKNKENALNNLLTPKPEFLQEKLKEVHTKGVNYFLKSVSCVHDIRAVFGKNDKKILTYVPIYQIRLILKTDQNEEKHCIFQANEKTFDNLLKHFKEYKKQMNSLKKEFKDKLK